MLDKPVKNILRRQALMPEDVDVRVAEAECFAGVDLGLSDADRPLHKIHVVPHGDTQAILRAANEEIALHVSTFPMFTGDYLKPRKRLACAADSTRGDSRCEERVRWPDFARNLGDFERLGRGEHPTGPVGYRRKRCCSILRKKPERQARK